MMPIVYPDRCSSSSGLWSSKISGEFQDGDASFASHMIEGIVEIKEMGSNLRIFFKNISITQRQRILTKNEEQDIISTYLENKKHEFIKKSIEQGQIIDENITENNKMLTIEPSDERNLEKLYTTKASKSIELPRLVVFITQKKPKNRMTDIHKTGQQVLLKSTDNLFGMELTTGNFEAPLKSISDNTQYAGVVVVKLPHDEPRTKEPIIYGFVKLESTRTAKIKTSQVLELSQIVDKLNFNNMKTLDGNESVKSTEIKDIIQVKDFSTNLAIKPLRFYQQIASKVFAEFQKTFDSTVDFNLTCKLLDRCNIFVIRPQVKRLFATFKNSNEDQIDLAAFENLLIAYDILLPYSTKISLLDAFDAFKLIPQDHPEFTHLELIEGLDYAGYCEAMEFLERSNVSVTHYHSLMDSFSKGTNSNNGQAGSACLTFEQFKDAWSNFVDIPKEMKKMGIKVSRNIFQNKKLLMDEINIQEQQYLNILNNMLIFVEKVKSDKRAKRDAIRKEKATKLASLQHEMERFMAIRSKDKRINTKKSEEDKTRKKLDQIVLTDELQEKEQLAEETKRQIKRQKALEEENRIKSNLRRSGLDKIDLSLKNLRRISKELYSGSAIPEQLQYTLIADFSRNIIDELPDEQFFEQLTVLKKLDLSQNRIKSIPEQIILLVELEVLDVRVNQLEEVHESVFNLKELKYLDLSCNNLNSLPENCSGGKNLRTLTLHSNRLTMLPSTLFLYHYLERLDLSGNLLIEIPERVDELLSLRYFNISNNRLTHLPSTLGNCKQLNYLDASNNSLYHLPKSFCKLSKLEICRMNQNFLSIEDRRLEKLFELRELSMSKCSIEKILSEIGTCVNIQRLDLSHNRIQILPVGIGLLTQLEELNLSNNFLADIPMELGSCKTLHHLELQRNLFSGQLTDYLGLIRNLRYLDISFNTHLTSLPNSIVGISQLEIFNCSYCSIKKIPATFQYLNKLKELRLACNKIDRFPECIYHLASLNNLDLSGNLISLLPQSISRLSGSNIINLDLSRNRLKALPIEFIDVLEYIEQVNLTENPWDGLPLAWLRLWSADETESIAQRYDTAKVLEYLYSIRSVYSIGLFIFTSRKEIGLKEFICLVQQEFTFKNQLWRENLVPYLEQLYFLAKEKGHFPIWHSQSEEDGATVNSLEESHEKLKISQISQTKKAEAEYEIIKNLNYKI